MNIQAKLMALAINYITEVMETEYIYCFGTRNLQQYTGSVFMSPEKAKTDSIHFDLLVVTDDLCPRPDFIGKLEEIGELDVTVSLMVCTLSALHTALKNNNRFYHTVISKGRLVHCKAGNTALLSTGFDWKQDMEAVKDYRENCAEKGTKRQFILMDHQGIFEVSAIPLYTKNMIEVCKEVIYVCMGYEPEGYSLKQLLDLCYSVDLKFNELIPKHTEKDIFQYNVLMDGYWKKDKGVTMEPQMSEIYACCERLISHAEAVCTSRIKPIAKV